MNDENKVQAIHFVSLKKMMMYLLIYLIGFCSIITVEGNLINYIPPTALGVGECMDYISIYYHKYF